MQSRHVHSTKLLSLHCCCFWLCQSRQVLTFLKRAKNLFDKLSRIPVRVSSGPRYSREERAKPCVAPSYWLVDTDFPNIQLEVSARGGAEVALGIYYKTFLIYRTCMHRAPARPVRACFVRSCCTDVVQEHDLRATPVQCNAKIRLSAHFTLHSSPFTLHTSSQIM